MNSSLSITRTLCLASVLLLACAMVSLAQTSDNTRALSECALIDADQQRYDCYDRILRRSPQPPTSSAPANNAQPSRNMGINVTVGSLPAAGIRAPSENREQFGLPQPRLLLDEDGKIGVLVTGVRSNPYGKLIFTTSEGQVWEQTDLRSNKAPKTPYNATIREASMGGYFLRADNGNSVRVRRKK